MSSPRRQLLARAETGASAFIALVMVASTSGKVPAAVLWLYLLLSAVTFGVYAWDKSAAKRGAWRTSEKTLHALAVAGGWPGAVFAQNRLRHKSSKQSFRTVFWGTVVINLVLFATLFRPGGSEKWQSVIEELLRAV